MALVSSAAFCAVGTVVGMATRVCRCEGVAIAIANQYYEITITNGVHQEVEGFDVVFMYSGPLSLTEFLQQPSVLFHC